MSQEKFQSGMFDNLTSTEQYEDIERLRLQELEEETIKDQSSKLGWAGLMAVTAGVALIAIQGLAYLFPGNIFGALQSILPMIALGASGYGIIQLLRQVVRGKTIDLPELNVFRKTSTAASNAGQSQAQYARNTGGTQRQEGRGTLRRSRVNKVFAGVAGGIAEYTGVSPALIRLSFVFGTFLTSGMVFFAYLLLTIALKKNYDDWRTRDSR